MARISPASYSRYAPLRYEITRPFSADLAAKCAANYFPSKLQRSNFFFREILPELISASRSSACPPDDISVHIEVENLKTYTEFLVSGRIVYDFHKNLSKALAKLDLGSLKMSAVHKPYDAFYLHFGEADWPIEALQHVEGAFVSWGNPSEDEDFVSIHVIKDAQFANPLFWADPDRELSEHFTINVSENAPEVDQQLNTMAARWKDSSGGTVLENALSNAEIDGLLGHMRAVFSLVINCMNHLADISKQIEEVDDLRELASREGSYKPSEDDLSSEATLKPLSNRDYLKVSLIGTDFASHQGKHFLGGANHKKAAHLRKGHYRNQRFGPKRAFKKLVFINPMMINSASDVQPGRIYVA